MSPFAKAEQLFEQYKNTEAVDLIMAIARDNAADAVICAEAVDLLGWNGYLPEALKIYSIYSQASGKDLASDYGIEWNEESIKEALLERSKLVGASTFKAIQTSQFSRHPIKSCTVDGSGISIEQEKFVQVFSGQTETKIIPWTTVTQIRLKHYTAVGAHLGSQGRTLFVYTNNPQLSKIELELTPFITFTYPEAVLQAIVKYSPIKIEHYYQENFASHPASGRLLLVALGILCAGVLIGTLVKNQMIMRISVYLSLAVLAVLIVIAVIHFIKQKKVK